MTWTNNYILKARTIPQYSRTCANLYGISNTSENDICPYWTVFVLVKQTRLIKIASLRNTSTIMFLKFR